MKITILSGAIQIDGEGAGVPAAEIQRVARLFAEMFGVYPRVRIRGVWDRDAIKPPDPGQPDERPDVWDLTPTLQHHPVLFAGSTYVNVQLERGLNGGRAVHLDSRAGRQVTVRLLLP